MKHANSEFLSKVTGPDGRDYHLHFYGEDEGAAVLVGPVSPPNTPGGLREVSEVHRQHAGSAAEARAKLRDWLRASGWTV